MKKVFLSAVFLTFSIAACGSGDDVVSGDRDAHGPGREKCEAAGGLFNECSNRCRLDSQGKQHVECSAVCEVLCECGMTSSAGCPDGYFCQQAAPGVKGYCVRRPR